MDDLKLRKKEKASQKVKIVQCYESHKNENLATNQSNIQDIIGKHNAIDHNDELILS